MKKLVLFVVSSVLSLAAAAQHHGGHSGSYSDYGSELIIRTWDNHPFSVIFDRQVYSASSEVFRLDKISPGTHRLVIKRSRYGRYGEHVEILFKGDIHIPKRTKLVVKAGGHNNIEIVKRVPLSGSGYGSNQGGYGGGYYSNGNTNHSGNYSGGGYYSRPRLNFEDLKISLLNANYESDRLLIAEQAVSAHSVSAEDVYSIMMLFSFESTRLDFAQFAYPHCEDKRNYYRVNDAFSFSSSIRKLNDYISGYTRRSGQYEYYDYR